MKPESIPVATAEPSDLIVPLVPRTHAASEARAASRVPSIASVRAGMVRTASVVLLLGTLILPSQASARVNPLRVIDERLMRAEVLITLDTSGSMAWYPSPEYTVGSDCGGRRTNTVDLCGDRMCTGNEGSTANRCTEDCNLTYATTYGAGAAPSCNPSSVYTSRMFILKRVLRNLLPDLRKSVNFGLATFAQTGYYRYYPATLDPGRPVTIFISRFEMERKGAWNATTNAPATSFTQDGVTYTLLSATSLAVKADSLYSRTDNTGTETRYRFSDAGVFYSQGGYSWRYSGSYYTYTQRAFSTATSLLSAQYRGPQFVDDAGNVWVYNRFDYQYIGNGINYGTTGMIVESIEADQDQTSQDSVLERILGRLNTSNAGGIWAWGGTPTGPAVETARQHFIDRHLGTGPFSTDGSDPLGACRPRFILLLTDGQSNSGISPWLAVQATYNHSVFTGNPVRTLVVGLPGLPSSAISELDLTADMGDDGKANNSTHAFYANDETSLAHLLKQVLFDLVKGDYATTPAGVTTSEATIAVQDMALVPSTEFPGWKGHFRAIDMTTYPGTPVWDAGVLLESRPFDSRRLYTGLPRINQGQAIPFFSATGDVNVNGGCTGCGSYGIKAVWAEFATPPADANIAAMVKWLAGQGRTWKLGPMVNSTPATVGAPPAYSAVESREVFRKTYMNRERLTYVTSNDGFVHAFRAKDGTEAFAFLVPNLLPKVYELWQQGGQDGDPQNFKWLLASSPRVEDVPVASSTLGWATHMAVSMGPGGKHFVVLDITNPSSCVAGQCSVNSPPLKVVAHSMDLSVSTLLGETWSVPAYYYRSGTSGTVSGNLAMGSGYSTTGEEGNYYLSYSTLYNAPASSHHAENAPLVDYAVLPNTTAAVDEENGRQVVATYQADLNGRILRYDQGDANLGTTLLSLGAGAPFYYSPAALYIGNDTVILAAVSDSQDEASPAASVEAKLIIRSEKDGIVDLVNDTITCDVSDICSRSSGCPDDIPSDCTAPTAKAKPVSKPLLLQNEVSNGVFKYEAFYLVYDPPTSACRTGKSWLIRISTDGTTQQLVSSVPYDDTRATGLTTIGGGVDLAITHIGVDGLPSMAFAVMDNVLTGNLIGLTPTIETWREVR